MGSFEKLVVLTVLFLVTLVLGVTLNSGASDGGDAAIAGPLDSARQLADGGGFLAPEGEEPALLSAGGETVAKPQPAATTPAPRSTPSRSGGALLINSTGLRVHPLLADFRIYRVARDDTWTALGQRFYGDRSLSGLLRQANDGLETLIAGEEILVPVRDFREEDARRERLEPWERGEAQPRTTPPRTASNTAATGSTDQAKAKDPVTTPSRYEVVSGDVLSVISLKVYGTSRRWEEIYQANRDQLDDPDTLPVGIELRIP